MIPSQLLPVVNHLWQSTLFAAGAALLALFLRPNRAHVRYWLWLSASLKFLLPFSLIVAVGGLLGRNEATTNAALNLPAVVHFSSLAQHAATVPFSAAPTAQPSYTGGSFASYILVWAIGFTTLLFRWTTRWWRMRKLLRAASALDFAIRLPVMTSPSFLEPGVFGIVRSVLLLPEGIMHHLTPRELDAIVAHELCHVRHRDNLAGAIHMLVEALFWFHPLVWCLGARLMDERERRCDEEVLRSGGEPRVYAEGILKVCDLYLASPLVCAAGITGGNLKRRIEAIMSRQTAIRLTFAKRLALSLAAACAFAAPAIVGIVHASTTRTQSTEIASSPAKFNTVSIRPFSSRPTDFFNTQFLMYVAHRSPFGGRLQTEINLSQLIQLAYDAKDFQIVGGPSWLNTDRYAFDAKTGTSITFQQMQPMLQALLADRFKLTFHRETKQLLIYELKPENSGLKIAATQQDSCIPMDPHAPPGSYDPNDPSSRLCKDDVRLAPDGEFFRSDRITMPRLVDLVSNEVHRIVVDRTGFTEPFNLRLKFAPSEDARWSGPSIDVALQQQLGMQLQSTQGPVEMLLIDHLEKPSDN